MFVHSTTAVLLLAAMALSWPISTSSAATAPGPMKASEKQVTRGPGGRILTNIGVWSPDSRLLVFDTRSDPAGERFDGSQICVADVESGKVRTIYEARNGAYCGVATFNPRENKVAFILGPENPSPDWQYNAYHRQGVIVDLARPGIAVNLDARDLTPPFTPGALRGGSHVHVWDAAGQWVSFTYEDHVLTRFSAPGPDHDLNRRNIAVSVPAEVRVPKSNRRNHDGQYFTVLVTRTTANPRPGSDDITRACEEGWVGTNGYVRADGSRQRHALAFQGLVSISKQPVSEVFIVDLPEDLMRAGDGPLAGTEMRMPFTPKGCDQRRLTFTGARKYPGIQGPRHWLRSSPNGSRIAFLMKDDEGIVQLWTVSPIMGEPRQLTHSPWSIASTFTWSPDGALIAHVANGCVCVTEAETGRTTPLTRACPPEDAPRPEACVFSPDGKKIAYVRHVAEGGTRSNHIFVLKVDTE